RFIKNGEIMSHYWVVGASWGGTEHQDTKFLEQGIWMLGWDEKSQPAQYKNASQIQSGDRIAIKRMKGRGQTGIKILHLGIVKGVILDTDRVICTVDWVATNLDRNIEESRGCFKSIHGPFEKDDWVEKVFCL
ncbi:TPA: hypothetical protein ACRZ2U_005572, partial [Vibrio harveyi]